MKEFMGHAQTLASMSEVGSPALVTSAGRILGLGADEQQALARGDVPRWAVFALGAIAGSVLMVGLRRLSPRAFDVVSGG